MPAAGHVGAVAETAQFKQHGIAAGATAMAVPLGEGPGEANLQTPFNGTGRATVVLVSVKNHSATLKRRILKKAVSFWRGGDAAKKDYADMSPESLQRAAIAQDMNVYEDVVKPQKAKITFDGKDYIIPPASKSGEEPQAIPVPEGVWDLYCGNYERMNSRDQKTRGDEIYRVQARIGKRNPVIQLDENGENTNPFGFLEFIRTEVVPTAAAVDGRMLRAQDILEV